MSTGSIVYILKWLGDELGDKKHEGHVHNHLRPISTWSHGYVLARVSFSFLFFSFLFFSFLFFSFLFFSGLVGTFLPGQG